MGNNNRTGSQVGNERWRYETESSIEAVEVYEGTVYIGDYTGNLYARDTTDGSHQWENISSGMYSIKFALKELGVSESHVVATTAHCIHAMSRTSGVNQWEFETEEGATPFWMLVDDAKEIVYIQNDKVDSGEILALDLALGSQKWCFSPEKSGALAPLAMTDEIVVVLSESGKIYGINASGGTKQWQCRISDNIYVVGDAELVYAVTENGCLYAVDVATGTQQWTCEFEVENEYSCGIASSKVTSLDIGGGMIFAGTDGSDLIGLNLTPNGARKEWHFNLDPDSNTSGEINRVYSHEETVYIGTRSRRPECLCAVNANIGSEIWRFEMGSDVSTVTSLAVWENTVFAGTTEGLYAVATEHNRSSGYQSNEPPEENVPSERTDKKRILHCQSCGSNLNEYGDVDFCPECGAERTPESDCSNCETDLKQYGDVDFCPECGVEVNSAGELGNGKI